MKYILDTKESYMEWKGSDEENTNLGTLKFKGGEIEVKDRNIIGGKIIIDMETLNTTASELSDDDRNVLNKRLRSEEFFDTDRYDEIVFKIEKSSLRQGEGQITGIVRVKDHAFGVAIPIKVSFDEASIKTTGQFSIARVSNTIHQFIGEGYEDETPQIEVLYYVIATR